MSVDTNAHSTTFLIWLLKDFAARSLLIKILLIVFGSHAAISLFGTAVCLPCLSHFNIALGQCYKVLQLSF